MIATISHLWPEIALFATTCLVMVMGQSKQRSTRDLCPWASAVGLCVAGYLAWSLQPIGATALPFMPVYIKVLVCAIGLVLIMMMAGTVDREIESAVDSGRPFEAIRSSRGEFYSFVLFSLTGLMLCASSQDLILLFLALELVSLPTYVMVSISTARNRSMEAGVKYFFLGALGAAIFLYGFAMIYGGTGSTSFLEIQRVLRDQAASGGINMIAMLGIVLAVLGICFKIAAVPMHFYTPDVYQGASANVAGFLAFVPKAAGFVAILLLVSLVGWQHKHDMVSTKVGLPLSLYVMLWVIAALTMTLGNVLALMQHSVKRILAYSSIAHSGYMLVGVIAGPGPDGAGFTRNGIAAVLFYLASYGVMTLGAFAVLSCLERRTKDGQLEEADDIDDLRGLASTRPVLGWTMVLCSMGLLGLPPLLGFLGKLPLFTSGIGAGEIALVLVLGINSAIAAYYYLRLAYVCFIDKPETIPGQAPLTLNPFQSRELAGVVSAAGVVVLAIFGGFLADRAMNGAQYRGIKSPSKAEFVEPARPTNPPQAISQR